MMRCALITLAAVLLGAGCLHGPRLDRFKPAIQPEGIQATIWLRGGEKLSGELLAAPEDGLIIRANKIVMIPFERIKRGDFAQRKSLLIGSGRVPHPGKHEQLRLMSRFPQGLDGAVLDRLLEAYGQRELVVFE